MKYFFIFLFSAFAGSAIAQSSDFILLKKKNKTVHSYYAGSSLEFITKSGVYKNAYINKIANDSIYLQEFVIRKGYNAMGFVVIDTVGSYHYVYNYNDIASIGKKESRGFNVSGSGAALLGGGTILAIASGVVYLVDKEKFSPALLAASVGLAGIGYLMTKSGSKGYVIGKKSVRLNYIKVGS